MFPSSCTSWKVRRITDGLPLATVFCDARQRAAPGAGAALQERDRVTLDIDVPVVPARKKTARRTDQGRRGDTPMVGHIAGTGQAVKSGLRRGSVPPAARNRAFPGRASGPCRKGRGYRGSVPMRPRTLLISHR